jgi:hypothetical protein
MSLWKGAKMTRRLFSIGKIIQIRTDSERVHKLAFIETEEHLRHTGEIIQWLYPNAGHEVKRAAREHDIGKKIYLLDEFVSDNGKRDHRLKRDNLKDDFYGTYQGEVFRVDEAINRYLKFLKSPERVKLSIIRQDPSDDTSPIEEIRYRLAPPFGNHAASVELQDLRNDTGGDINYIHNLIHLHHNFQADKLVAAAVKFGEPIIADLYRLITADHEASRWAEHVVQKLEGGGEQPQGKFGFSEFAVENITEPEVISRNGLHVQGKVKLKATRRLDLGEKILKVDYYVRDYDLNPDKFLAAKKKGGRKK